MALMETYRKCSHFIMVEYQSYYKAYVYKKFVWYLFTGFAIATAGNCCATDG